MIESFRDFVLVSFSLAYSWEYDDMSFYPKACGTKISTFPQSVESAKQNHYTIFFLFFWNILVC